MPHRDSKKDAEAVSDRRAAPRDLMAELEDSLADARVLSKCRDSDGDGDCYLCRTGYWLCPKKQEDGFPTSQKGTE